MWLLGRLVICYNRFVFDKNRKTGEFGSFISPFYNIIDDTSDVPYGDFIQTKQSGRRKQHWSSNLVTGCKPSHGVLHDQVFSL